MFACDVDNIVKEAGHYSIPMDEELFASTVIKIKKLTDRELEALNNRAKRMMEYNYDYSVIGEKYINMLEAL